MEAAGYSRTLPSVSRNDSAKHIRRYERTLSKFCKVMQAHYSPPFSAEVKNEWSLLLLPLLSSWHRQGSLPLIQAHYCSTVANTRHEKESSIESSNLLKRGIRRVSTRDFSVHSVTNSATPLLNFS
jgi:hypothetical protein